MMRLEREVWLEPLIAVIASVILYQFTMLFFVFTVPLHMLALRKDKRSFLTASGIVLLAVLLQDVVLNIQYGLSSQDTLIFAIGLFGPLMLLLGTLWFHTFNGYLSRIYRFIGSWIIPALFGFILILVFEGNSQTAVYTRELIQEQIVLVIELTKEIYGDIFPAVSNVAIYTVIVEIIKRGFLPSIIMQMGFGLVLAYSIQGRITRRKAFELPSFRVPEQLLWPFLIAWALVLLSSFVQIGILGVIGWNIGLSLALLYFIQGLAILIFKLRRRIPALRSASIIVWVIVLLLLPGINVLAMVGIPLYGISEIWIHYRDVNKEKSNENYS